MLHPRPIEEDHQTNGETMKEYQGQCERVMDPDIANGVSWVLKGCQPGGSASQRGIGLPNGSAAKTGTNINSSQTWLATLVACPPRLGLVLTTSASAF